MKLLTVIACVYALSSFLEVEAKGVKLLDRLPDKSTNRHTGRGKKTIAVPGGRRCCRERLGMKLYVNCISENGAGCGRRPLENSRNRRESEAYTSADWIATLNDTTKTQHKIKGGHLAGHGMFPWQARIERVGMGHWCGGTIISNHWILSAAHCFQAITKSDVLLKVGDHKIDSSDEGEQTFEVEKIIMHVNYDTVTWDYDIALLKVKPVANKSIVFNEYVQAACLPSSITSYTSRTECLISGWGETGQGNNGTLELRAASVPIRQDSECRYIYKGDITPRMLCAGDSAKNIDTCRGDSAGPLVCKINAGIR